jgi:AmiR/NasT family two-component response regulator
LYDPDETAELAMQRWEESRSCVLQASGMISAQADCTTIEALAMMRDRSHVQRQSLVAIADAVVAREIRFAE